jgi:hypothetical protein
VCVCLSVSLCVCVCVCWGKFLQLRLAWNLLCSLNVGITPPSPASFSFYISCVLKSHHDMFLVFLPPFIVLCTVLTHWLCKLRIFTSEEFSFVVFLW